MDFDGIENLTEDEILELYGDIIEQPDLLAYEVCEPWASTGKFTYETLPNGTKVKVEICK